VGQKIFLAPWPVLRSVPDLLNEDGVANDFIFEDVPGSRKDNFSRSWLSTQTSAM